MGVSIQEHRARIGRYVPTSRSKFKCCASSSGYGWKYRRLFPSLLICALLLLISGVEQNPGPDYQCRKCTLICTSVAGYFHQQKEVHALIPCISSECSFKASSLGAFDSHLKRNHPNKHKSGSDIPCPVLGCQIPRGHSVFKEHLESHLDAGHEFRCPYGVSCNTEIKKKSSFRTHLCQCHPEYKLPRFASSSHRTSSTSSAPTTSAPSSSAPSSSAPSSSAPSSSAPSSSAPSSSAPSSSAPSSSAPTSSATIALNSSATSATTQDFVPGSALPPNVVKFEVLKFYLELKGVKVLPSASVQFISEKIGHFVEMSHECLKQKLSKELSDLGLDQIVIQSVKTKTFNSDPVFNIHHKEKSIEQVTSIYLRREALKNNLPYLPATEIQLPSSSGKPKVAHFVSIREALTLMLKDKDVKEEILQSFTQPPRYDYLEDFIDGSVFKKHKEEHNHDCIQLIFFQDGFEFNPFGPAKGLYKTLGFYYMVGNLRPEHRSKLDIILLAFIIQEQFLKQTEREHLDCINKFEEALSYLTKDLTDLRENGLLIDGVKYPVCVLFFTGDNLGSHQIGSFVQSFSGEYVCRFCPISMSEFRADPTACKEMRTQEHYEECGRIAKEKWNDLKTTALESHKKKKEIEKRKIAAGEEVKKKVSGGLVSKSFLTKLMSVHHLGVKPLPSALLKIPGLDVTKCLPSCIGHDLFEGCVDLVLAKILKHFIETKQWFSLATLNKRITGFNYKNEDAADAPNALRSFDGIKSHACETWTLLRLLPFLIMDLIQDPEDDYWQLYLQLKEMCEYICAPKITMKQISYLASCIKTYLCNVKKLLPACLTPKHHYLSHYPALIQLYGPLIRLFTLRFESRHVFFKNVARQCKSFRNITLTLAQKYQYRFAFDHIKGFLSPSIVLHSDREEVSVDQLQSSITCDIPQFQDAQFKNIQMTRDITIRNTYYKKNMWLLIAKSGIVDLEVGRIVNILIYPDNSIHFVLENHVAKSSGNGYYVIDNVTGMKVINSSNIPDYYPLSSYEIMGEQAISLKHAPIFL